MNITKILEMFATKVLALAFTLFGIVCILNEKVYNYIENEILLLLIILLLFTIGLSFLFFELVSYIRENYNKKKIRKVQLSQLEKKYEDARINFDLLEKDDARIIWNIFYNERIKIEKDRIIDLYKRGYLEITETEYKRRATIKSYVKIDDNLINFFKNIHNKNIIKSLKNLTDNEKNILNMFFDKKEGSEYYHPVLCRDMQNGINTLNNNKVIDYKYNEYIKLNDETIDNISIFSNKKI